MRQRVENWFVMAIVTAALAACSTTKPKPVDPNLFPANYKREILDTMTGMLIDPTNVRDAFISDPVLTTVDKEQRYTVCIRYNARDDSRQYMGSTDRIGYFYAGHLNQLIKASNGQCAAAAYKPFPELEKLCQATKCE
ncbi:MAG: hypothetical protein ACREB8_15925 [Pseudolabrys sp.]